jgi:hypothetical protein
MSMDEASILTMTAEDLVTKSKITVRVTKTGVLTENELQDKVNLACIRHGEGDPAGEGNGASDGDGKVGMKRAKTVETMICIV